MYKKGQIIAADGKLYEYERKFNDFHIVYEIEVDEDGYLTATHQPHGLSDRMLADDEIHFTKNQWYGIVAHFIREGNFHLNEEEMEDITEDIVERCFAYGVPKFHELEDYIAEYMNR